MLATHVMRVEQADEAERDYDLAVEHRQTAERRFAEANEAVVKVGGAPLATPVMGMVVPAVSLVFNGPRTEGPEEAARPYMGDCGECLHCRDKPKFGGKGTRRQACMHRTYPPKRRRRLRDETADRADANSDFDTSTEPDDTDVEIQPTATVTAKGRIVAPTLALTISSHAAQTYDVGGVI